MDKVLPTNIENYETAVRWIYDRIDYERIRPQRTSEHFRLERMERLLALIDSPHERIPAVHIAGTKGKGSTAVMVDSILKQSGLRSGLFTSPHIHAFEERMRVCGRMPAPDELTSLVAELHERLAGAQSNVVEDGPTYFEVATLLAWMFFDRSRAEIAVLETGLGGRLDCTNLCRPLVTIITAIGLDHTHILGDTIAQIAAEKAGILKPEIPVLCWPVQRDAQCVITSRANELKCPMQAGGTDIQVSDRRLNGDGQTVTIITAKHRYQDLYLPLQGEHQTRNAALAVAAAELLAASDSRITSQTIAAGLKHTVWPLRFERFPGPPNIILDAAHNPDAAAALVRTLCECAGPDESDRTLIFASSKDKDAQGMLKHLLPHFGRVILTTFLTNPRASSVEELKLFCHETTGIVKTAASPNEALELAKAETADTGLICGTGSIFLAAELRDLLVSRS